MSIHGVRLHYAADGSRVDLHFDVAEYVQLPIAHPEFDAYLIDTNGDVLTPNQTNLKKTFGGRQQVTLRRRSDNRSTSRSIPRLLLNTFAPSLYTPVCKFAFVDGDPNNGRLSNLIVLDVEELNGVPMAYKQRLWYHYYVMGASFEELKVLFNWSHEPLYKHLFGKNDRHQWQYLSDWLDSLGEDQLLKNYSSRDASGPILTKLQLRKSYVEHNKQLVLADEDFLTPGDYFYSLGRSSSDVRKYIQ